MQSEVTLKCRDGVDLLLPVEVAKESKTLDQILSNDLFMESMTMEIEMEDFNSDVMKVVVECRAARSTRTTCRTRRPRTGCRPASAARRSCRCGRASSTPPATTNSRPGRGTRAA